MGSKVPLVQYRRTSSDMDLSTSDEDDNANQETKIINQQQPLNKSVPNDLSEPNFENNIKRSVDNKTNLSCEIVHPSSSHKDDRLDGDRLKEQKQRDDKRENGRRDSRSREYGKERRDKRKNSSDSKHRDRSSSPDRRKRRSPDRSRRSPYRHRSRSPGRRKYSPDRRERKRSHSPEYRSRRHHGNSRLGRKVARIDKLGLELFAEAKTSSSDNPMLANFCNPSTINPAARLTEQIQKRKLLWGAKKETPAMGETVHESAGTSKTWEAATFKGDNDGKMTEKFKRLMGIKGDGAPAATLPNPPANNSLIKKQEEMFSNMEAQYQVARMATHTHRGIGLGFGTFQVPPR